MSKYKYRISMSYLDTKNSKETLINAAYIKMICIEKDYMKLNMPIMIAQLELDKNLVDDIILNNKDNLFNMFIYKYAEEGDQYAERVLQGQFVYFLNKDINYNKDLDYSDQETALNGGTKREDKFRTIELGLMMKSNIDNNKKVINDVFYNANMLNIITAITKHMTILIEPFTYNKTIEQLVLPPMESIAKALDFLNNTNVFYDTPFMYFIDYDLAYLLSTSGAGVQKSTDKYNSVIIDVKNISEKDSFTEGMTIDDTNGNYYIPVSTVNTTYVTNYITSKKFNNIIAIIDVGKELAEAKTSSILSVLNTFKSAVNKITDSVKNIQEDFADAGNKLNDIKNTIYDEVDNSINNALQIDNCIATINDVFSDPGITEDEKNKNLKEIFELKDSIENTVNSIKELPDTYMKIKDNLLKSVQDASSFTNFVNGVKEINLSDNVSAMNELKKNVTNLSEKNKKDVNDSFGTASDKFKSLTDDIQKLIDKINGLPDKIYTSSSSSKEKSSSEGETTNFIDVSEAKSVIPLLEELIPLVDASYSNIKGTSDYLVKIPETTSLTAKKASVGIDIISSTPNVLKDEFNGKDNTLFNSASIKLNTNKTNTISYAKSFSFNDFIKDQTNKIVSKGVEIGNSLLSSIKTNLDNIADISNIGITGITELNTDININVDLGAAAKSLLIRVPNDNTNLLKQLKHQVELSASRISINKNDLDTNVLTPNKVYTIKNYDTHSKEDGKFLLTKKREIYIRTDDTFTLNTILDLQKLPENKK